MDFNDTPEEAEFRAEVRAWLKKEAAEYSQAPAERLTDVEEVPRAKDWQAKKADAGYAAITWPEEVGGRGGTPMQRVIFEQEQAEYHLPRDVFAIGLGMCIPTMLAYATKEQLARYVRPALRGEEIWCQLFSEPAAGSDLAALRTKAVPDGDDWIINGQKIWTSGAHFSDFGVIVTRSDPTVAKHKGLTYFFLDMRSPGIEIKPIKQVSGESNFNEVFFNDVRIPDVQRLGEVGDGWKVSLTTLMNERLAIGNVSGRGASVMDLLELGRMLDDTDGPAIANRAVREKLADWYTKYSGLRNGRFRALTALSKGEQPGPENSITKAVFAAMLQDMASHGMDMMDMSGSLSDPGVEGFNRMFSGTFLSAPGFRIAGGTDEILRNIIAERVLGLPADIRVDKGVPFNEIPTGSS